MGMKLHRADRCRADLEARDEVDRRAELVRQREPNRIAVTYQRHRVARMITAEPRHQANDSRLDFEQ